MAEFDTLHAYLTDYLQRTAEYKGRQPWSMGNDDHDEDLVYVHMQHGARAGDPVLHVWRAVLSWRADFVSVTVERDGEPTLCGGFHAPAPDMEERNEVDADGTVTRYVDVLLDAGIAYSDRVQARAQRYALDALLSELDSHDI